MIQEMFIGLKGLNGRLIHNTLWSNVDNPQKIALFFPGYRYTGEAPLFHFLKMQFMEKGWAVLAIDYRYNENPEFLKLSDADQYTYIKSEALLIRDSIKENLIFKKYCFIAKSLGTTLLFNMIEDDPAFLNNNHTLVVWLTPAESNKSISNIIIQNSINSIYVIGDEDPYYDESILSTLRENPCCTCKVVSGAGHIFNSRESLELTMKNNFDVIRYLIQQIGI